MNLKSFFPSIGKPVLTPSEKTHLFLLALSDLTMQCIVENRVMFTSQDRRRFLRDWAVNLRASWIPEGLTEKDMQQIPEDWMVGIVFALADGNGVGGYEQRLYERFENPVEMPKVPEQEHEDRVTLERRPNLRRRMF